MNFTLFVHSRHGITSETKCPQQQCMHGVRSSGLVRLVLLFVWVLELEFGRWFDEWASFSWLVLNARPNWLDITTNSGP